MVSTGKKTYDGGDDSSLGSSLAYFQSVVNNPSSKKLYTNSTSGIDEIITAEN
eukprot:CAMPEP_0178958762 /NCGR_PEP_ID=MMETSP0789-20121207/11840_1 /TAXON_ID=3005 /ORGANISM="Rhizosolenia setigera, Strain CCMP 1694" /LENGTH=52 /DNA_ID=CAMNT_0020641539 /DNA_START=385 /DNA_END=543 /DNA_ORIENTATION=+